MKKILLLSIITFGMLLNTYAKPASKTVRLKVIETSDVHGHFFPYDFMEKNTCTSEHLHQQAATAVWRQLPAD